MNRAVYSPAVTGIKQTSKTNVKAERMELSRERLSNFFKEFNNFKAIEEICKSEPDNWK